MTQGATYEGVGFEGKICGVSILRAGEVSIIPVVQHCNLFGAYMKPLRLWKLASGRFVGASGLARS